MGSKQLMTLMIGGIAVLLVVMGVLIVVAGRKPARHEEREQEVTAVPAEQAPSVANDSRSPIVQSVATRVSPEPATVKVPPKFAVRPADRGRSAAPIRPVDPDLVEMREIDGPKEGVRVLAFSSNGKKLAAGGEDKAVHVYDVESGNELVTMEHEGAITDVRFSPNGSKIVSTVEGGLHIWDATTGKQVGAIDPKGKVVQAKFAGNDRVAAAVGERLVIWNVEEGEAGEPERVIETSGEISCLDTSPDGEHIVTGQSKAGMIRVWNVVDGKMIAEHSHVSEEYLSHLGEQDQEQMRQVEEAEFLDNGHILAGGRRSGTYVLAWKENKSDDLKIMNSNPYTPEVWAGDHNRIVWNMVGGAAIRFFDTDQGTLQSPQFRDRTGRTVPVKIGNVDCSCVALGGDWAAVGSRNRPGEITPPDVSKIRLVRVQTMENAIVAERGAIQNEIEKAEAGALAKSQTPRGKLEAAFHDVVRESSVPVARVDGGEKALARLKFSPDGKYLAAAGGDHFVHLFDTSTWGEVRKLQGHTDAISDISFSKDSKKLLSSSWDDSVIEWDVASGRIAKRVLSNTHVLQCAFLPDGVHAATAGLYVQFWDMDRERLTGTGITEGEVHALAVSPGGTVASIDHSMTITIWDANTAKPLAKRSGKNFHMHTYFLDENTLHFDDIADKSFDWNWRTDGTKAADGVDVGFTPDGKLAVDEPEIVLPIGGGWRLIDFNNEAPKYGAGAVDPLDRYIAFGINGYFDQDGFESSGEGKIVVYDVKKLEVGEEAYRKVAAYDKEHNLDNEGRPLQRR